MSAIDRSLIRSPSITIAPPPRALVTYWKQRRGEMSERLKEHAWKACVGETLPWVRIPLSPPFIFDNAFIMSCLCLPCGVMVPHMVPIFTAPDQVTGFGSISLSIQATNKTLSCRIGTLLGSSVWSEVRPGLAAQSARLYVPAHRGGARVRGDHGRRIGDPHSDLGRQAETARRVRQGIGAVMKWAVAMGYRPDNPAGDGLGQALGLDLGLALLVPAG